MFIEQDVKEKLKALQYSPQWLEWGFIDVSFLEEQYQEFGLEKDSGSEHYRYGAFRRWLQNNEKYSDTEIKQFLELVECDPDEGMATSAAIDLLRWPRISKEQFDTIALFLIRVSGGRLANNVERERCLRELRRMGTISLTEFQRYMDLGDAVIQRYLYDNFTHSNIMFLQILEQEGKTKAIRNQAKQKSEKISLEKLHAQNQLLDRIQSDFSDNKRDLVMDCLSSIGLEHVMAESEYNLHSTRMAILELANGDCDEVIRLTECAKIDFRDVIYWAVLERSPHKLG